MQNPFNATSNYYDMDGKPIPGGVIGWAEMFENIDRRVGFTTVGRFDVSTVWLGMEHGFRNGKPLIFETMVFGPDERYCWRWATKEEALAGHWQTVRMALRGAFGFPLSLLQCAITATVVVMLLYILEHVRR